MYGFSLEWLRNDIGVGFDSVLSPIIATLGLPYIIVIIILAVFTGLYTALIQKYTMNYDKMKETQDKIKAFQVEYRAALAENDQVKLRALDIRNRQLMRENIEVTQAQFIPMIAIIFVTIPIFCWQQYHLSIVQSFITLPYYGMFNLHDTVIWIIPAWFIWYLICSLAITQIIRKTLNIGGV